MSSGYDLPFKTSAHERFLELFSVPVTEVQVFSPAQCALITGREGFERLVSGEIGFPQWAKATLPDGRRLLMDTREDRRRVIVESKPQVPGRPQWLRVVENEDQTGEGKRWIRRGMPMRINLCLSDWTIHAIHAMRRHLVPALRPI